MKRDRIVRYPGTSYVQSLSELEAEPLVKCQVAPPMSFKQGYPTNEPFWKWKLEVHHGIQQYTPYTHMYVYGFQLTTLLLYNYTIHTNMNRSTYPEPTPTLKPAQPHEIYEQAQGHMDTQIHGYMHGYVDMNNHVQTCTINGLYHCHQFHDETVYKHTPPSRITCIIVSFRVYVFVFVGCIVCIYVCMYIRIYLLEETFCLVLHQNDIVETLFSSLCCVHCIINAKHEFLFLFLDVIISYYVKIFIAYKNSFSLVAV